MRVGRTRYRKINIDLNILFMLVTLLVVCLMFYLLTKKGEREKAVLIRDMEEKNSLYKKEALLAAKEAVQKDIEKFQEETKERGQELSRLESKLSKKEELLEDKE